MDPSARATAWASREFLARAAEAVVTMGSRQLVDLGAGIPTSPAPSTVPSPGEAHHGGARGRSRR
ncbi:SAM-dependent methyltransferase [Nonomuraea angiospora]|uniref:SAM-dependent methyltransferase n=1 Tax=Nonomuraea angiospora TaxID=46172 RepID=UPI0037992485